MSRTLPFLVMVLAMPLASPVRAQTAADPVAHMTALKSQLAPGKQIFISRQMGLNPAEEASFWPIYDDHQKALADLVQRRRDANAVWARSGGNLDEDAATELAEELAEIDLDEAELNERTFSRLSRSLPPSKALKYMQLERQVSTLLRYELAATSPLVN